jgi:hypothetical protein
MSGGDENSDQGTCITGTPRDYSEDLYRFYLEIADPDRVAKKILIGFLGSQNARFLVDVEHGYELCMPIQCAPEIVRLLSDKVAVYQLVRLDRAAGKWTY